MNDGGCWTTAGERWFLVWPGTPLVVDEITLGESWSGAPEPGMIVAMARESGFSPVKPATWGRIKTSFR
jgi:hypothetical protein